MVPEDEERELWLISITKESCKKRTYLSRGEDSYGQAGRLNTKGQLLRKEEGEDSTV